VCLGRAFDRAETHTGKPCSSKARFWDRIRNGRFNERQQSMINKLLNRFEGKLTSSKWAKLDEVFSGHSAA
jgi:Fic family protein